MIITAVDKFSAPIKKLSAGLAKAGSLAAGLGKALGKVAVGITAAVGAVSLVVAKYVSMLDSIGKTSEKLGVDPLFLQKLRFAAEQTGVQITALDMGLQRFIRRTAEAARGTGEAKQALADLNISLFDSDGKLRDVESVLFDVADAIQNTTDSAEQVRLAFKFFDSEGVALVSTLKEGSEGLRNFFEEAENLGLLISRDTIKKAEQFADSVNRVKKQINAIASGIVGAFLPALDQLSAKLTNTLSAGRDADGTFDGLGKTIATTMVNALADAIRVVGQFGDTLEETFVGINNAFVNFQLTMLEALDALPLVSIEAEKFAEVQGQLMTATGAAGKKAEEFANKLTTVALAAINSTAKIKETEDAVGGLGASFPGLEKFSDGFAKVFNEGADKFADLEKLGENVANTLEAGLTDAFMNIRTGAEGLKDTMDQIAKAIIAELIRIYVVQQIVGAVTSFFPIPREKGGPVTAGRPYLVGEKGPELFVPGQSGGIVPNHGLAMAGGGDTNVNITYEIKAFDSKGATAAIAEQAPTIVGIVEQSFRKRGKRGPLG
mgnify:FL=1|tara:strand:+ start:7396 stop:9042 length:1647 start_codon:yes stop_codon:yes gene_type:complete